MNTRHAFVLPCLLLASADAHAFGFWSIDEGGGDFEPRLPRPRITLEVPNEAGVVAPGKVKVSVKAKAPGGLDFITVFVDNDRLCRAWTLEFECEWNATVLGPHTLRAAVGEEEEAEARVGVIVDSRLRVEFTKVPSGLVSGEYEISAKATSGARIRFLVDVDDGANVLKECGSQTACSTPWSTADVENGGHALVVTAEDEWKKSVFAASRVTVANAQLRVSVEPAAKIELLPQGRAALSSTQETKERVFDGLFPGLYHVRLTKDGYEVSQRSIQLGLVRGGDKQAVQEVLRKATTPPREAPKIVSFTADHRRVPKDGKTTLRWRTEHTTSCKLKDVDVEGNSLEVTVQATTDFVLTCSGPGGPDASSIVQVKVEEAPPTDELDCRDFKVISLTSSTVSVSFDSVIPANGRADWEDQRYPGYGDKTDWHSPRRIHEVTITSLLPSSKYNVWASVMAGSKFKSCAGRAVTTGAPSETPNPQDTVKPTAGIPIAPYHWKHAAVVTISGTAEDNDAVAKLRAFVFKPEDAAKPFELNPVKTEQPLPRGQVRWSAEWDSTKSPDGSYTIRVVATDRAGNEALAEHGGLWIANAKDETNLRNFRAEAAGPCRISARFITLVPSIGYVGYHPFVGDKTGEFKHAGRDESSRTDHAFTISGLAPNSRYIVHAIAAEPGKTAPSNQWIYIEVTTPAGTCSSADVTANATTHSDTGTTSGGGDGIPSGGDSSLAVFSPAPGGARRATITGHAQRRTHGVAPETIGGGAGSVSLVVAPRRAASTQASIPKRTRLSSTDSVGAQSHAASEPNSLSSCGGIAPATPDVYGEKLEPFAGDLLRAYDALAAGTEEGYGVRTLDGCLSLGARLAYAMKVRLPELGAACGVPEWTKISRRHQWEDLEAVRDALLRCEDDAVFGLCPNCGLAVPSGLGK